MEPVKQKEKVCILASPETHVIAEQYRTQLEGKTVDIQYQLAENHSFDRVYKIQTVNNEYKVVEQ
ncbi:hypothetical protein J416_07887 [Gracilibacillus halophilus YIM-C55.5]|uniref:Uncharacterized protein n=2 Tax=Gracilibacillus TaxID=74385 RepID=N4W9M2_9BACI|nr:hypothetical protein J416_07887 [Gracilibacillus halophilus YIM-C55.5]